MHSLSKKEISFSHSLCFSFFQLSQFSFVISSSLLYIIIKIIYNLSLLLYCVPFILILQHIINMNCFEGNSHILNLKLFICNKILHIYIIVDLFCYILLKVIKKLFDFVYNQSYTNAINLL